MTSGNLFSTLFLPSEATRYIARKDSKHDLALFLVFMGQVFLLPSVPLGHNLDNQEGWLAYIVSIVFLLSFYSFFYIRFYREAHTFLQDVIVLSVSSRFCSFFLVGILAVTQIGIFSFLELPRLPFASLVYYMAYYLCYGWLMISCKTR